MVVKTGKRKSINGSGTWEIETIPESPKQVGSKKLKLDDTPKSEDTNGKNRSIKKPSPFTPKKQKKGKNAEILKKSNQQEEKQTQQNKEEEIGEEMQPEPQFVNQEQQRPHFLQNKQSFQQNRESQETWQPRKDQITDPSKQKLLTWSSRDLLQLVVRLEDNSQDLLSEEYTAGLQKVDWEKVSFGDHSAEECKEIWENLYKRARTTREMVEEARELLLQKTPVEQTPVADSQNDTASKKLDDSAIQKSSDNGEEEEEEEEALENAEENVDTEEGEEDDDENDDDDDEEEEEQDGEAEEEDDDDDDDDDDE